MNDEIRMFQTHLGNRVNNTRLPLAKGMLPVFEAIMNSIHAIDARGNTDGRVDIYVQRHPGLSESIAGQIDCIVCKDNGVGFSDENYASFTTADSVYKSKVGGKGIGRLMYLKVFQDVEVESTFRSGNKWMQRKFRFEKTAGGIANHSLTTLSNGNFQTVVRLHGLQANYEKTFPLDFDDFCDRVIEHLLVIFLAKNPVGVFVHDDGKEACDVLRLAKQVVDDAVEKSIIKIETFEFECNLIKLYLAKDSGHRIVLCAHNREASKEKLSNFVPELTKKLSDSRGEYVIAAYVQGAFLDARVNQERTEILFDEDESSFLGTVTKQRLFDAIVGRIEAFAKDDIEASRFEKRKQIENHAEMQGVEYRLLLKPEHEYLLRDIPPGLSTDKLEAELHKRLFTYEVSIRTKANDLKETLAKDPSKYKELREKYKEVLSAENDIGKAKLADYVVHRKVILDLFEQAISRQDDGKYSLEAYVHDIIAPLGVTSNEVSNDSLNLWLVDERLAFHGYLASDKPLATAPDLDIESANEPDIFIFNKALALTNSDMPYSSMVIVEFKRPMRIGYSVLDDDPIEQVYEYARKIRASKALDHRGRPVGGEQVPLYAYVVCDFTPKIRTFCEDKGFSPTPDGMGYVGMNPKLNAFVEVLTYDKVLIDARKRNLAFFKRLNIA